MSRKPDLILVVGPENDWIVVATDRRAIKEGLGEADRILLVCEDDGRVSDITEDMAMDFLHNTPFEPCPPCYERYVGDLLPRDPQSRFEAEHTAY